jgi:hypothetical protein
MREPGVARGPTLREQALFLIALQPPAPWAPPGWPANQGAGVERDMDLPFAPRRVDGKLEDVELAIDRGPRDHLEPFVAISGQV